MPFKSRWSVDVPLLDLPSLIFPKQSGFIGDRPILLDADSPERYHLTKTGYRDWSKRFAAGLRANGFQDGDRVLLFSGNFLFFPCIFIGAIMAGGVFSGANPGYVDREVAYQLKDTGAKFFFTSEASLETSLRAADSIGFPRDRIFIVDNGYATFDGKGRDVKGIKHWSKLYATQSQAEAYRWQVLSTREQVDRTVALNYSSGTTGVPKGVMITHYSYVANTVQVADMANQAEGTFIKDLKAAWLCSLPMYHAYGQTFFCVNNVVRNTPVFIMQKYDFKKMLEYLEKYSITNLNLVPPIAVAMSKSPLVKKYNLDSIEHAGSGAAPLSSDTARSMEKLFTKKKVNMKQGWGMTEVTCSMTGWDPDEWVSDGSIGEMMANCECMMVDDNGKELPKGEVGEFWVRGPNVMKGYWNKPDATKDTLTDDGWLKTGDVAYINKRDRIYIVDRKKELIKVKGNQVAPAELEGLLLEIDEVADAAVIGVIIDGEEYPRAYCVLKEGSKTGPKDIRKALDARVTRHKRLVGGVKIVDSIPKNPSGKILRKELREQAKKEIGDSDKKQSRL